MRGVAAGVGLIIAGLALLGLAWGGSQRKLKRNHWAGIRTRTTMANDQAWYRAHEDAAGPLGLTGGLVALLGAGVLATGFDVFGLGATVIAGVLFFVGLGYSAIVAIRAASEVADGRSDRG